MSGDDLESLPASAHGWEQFVIDAPADASRANSAPSSVNFAGAHSNAVSVDGVSLGLAFGNTFAPSSSSPAQSASGQGSAESSGMGHTWSGGRSFAVSEAAVRQVSSSYGEADGESSRGSRTMLETYGGGESVHGQAFLFDRHHFLSARNSSANWIRQSAPATYATVPVFTPTPYSPSDLELRWGLGTGGAFPHKRLFWFGAFDGYGRDHAALASVKWPDNFFAQPSNDQVQLLGAQLGTNNTDALAQYSQMLQTLDGLLGPVTRTARQFTGFGRIDWRAGERHQLTIEGTGAKWSSPGGGLTRVSETYGNHSFGESRASQHWSLARWEVFMTPNLLSVTQISEGRSMQGIHAGAPSTYEQTLNQNVWGQLPQIVVDSSYGFTIGNPSRFGRGSYPDERFLRLQQQFDWIRGDFLLKTGLSFTYSNDHAGLLRNQTGTYHYATVANFISDALVFDKYGLSGALDPYNQHNCDQVGRPWRDSNGVLRGLGYLPCYSYYSQTMGPSDWTMATDDWAGFATAQWQPSKLLVFSVGLRWDLQQMPPPIATVANSSLPLAGQMPGTSGKWGPRLSLAFGRTERHLPILRLGYGLYYDRILNSRLLTALTMTGSPNGDLNFFMRPTDNLNAGGAPPFPYVFAGEPLNMVKPGVVEYAPKFRNPEVHQVVASIEQLLPGHMTFTASAMMSLARRLPISVDTNFDSRVNPQTITYVVSDTTGKGPIKASQITVPFYADWVSSTVPVGMQGRLNSNYQQITQITSRANSTYEAMLIRLVRSGRRGLSINARYTYGHAMDWNPNESVSVTGSDVLDPADFKHEYGVSDHDVRHTVATALIYRTPWKVRGTASRFANDWRISGIGSFHSGLPYTMRTSGSIPRVVNLTTHTIITGLGSGMNGSGGDNRVYGVGNDGVSYDIGRNTFRYPSAWKVDMRLGKQFSLGKMRQLELLAESFNLFNHRNVTDIETNGYSIGAATLSGTFPTLTYLTGLKANTTAFGQALNSNSTDDYRERQFQVGVRMHF